LATPVATALSFKGGTPNPKAKGGEASSLLHLSDNYTGDEVIAAMRNGGAPQRDNEAGPAPSLYMPWWKRVWSNEEIDRLADFLWPRQRKIKSWLPEPFARRGHYCCGSRACLRISDGIASNEPIHPVSL
jgi:hypothetical protein